MTCSYDAIYTDSGGSFPIKIKNDFKYLSFTIRGIDFIATDFDDVEIHNIEQRKDAAIQQFTWIKNALSHYSLQIQLPLNIINVGTQQLFHCESHLNITMKEEIYTARLNFELCGEHYHASSDHFESLFDQIQRQFLGKYRFKNCYGCLYADYSVFGQAQMGTMGCFKMQKCQYLAVKNKDDYMRLDDVEFCLQEIYCCEDYNIRDRNVGYRGTIE